MSDIGLIFLLIAPPLFLIHYQSRGASWKANAAKQTSDDGTTQAVEPKDRDTTGLLVDNEDGINTAEVSDPINLQISQEVEDTPGHNGRVEVEACTSTEAKIIDDDNLCNRTLPLSGASIYILSDGSCENDCYQEDQRNLTVAMIVSLGGILAASIDDATHALWISTSDTNTSRNAPTGGEIRLSGTARDALKLCNSKNVPVVDLSWLERVSGLDLPQNSPFDESNKCGVKTYASRRDSAIALGSAISATHDYLMKENPGSLEEDAVRRAIELSMLDFALVDYRRDYTKRPAIEKELDFETVLGVSNTATITQIKAAYRRKALETHPDRPGGDPFEFDRVARAYSTLMKKHQSDGSAYCKETNIVTDLLKSTAHWDSELKDHKNIVNDLFQSHGSDLTTQISKQVTALEDLGLKHKEAGASNFNERNEQIRNSCFYLSLAVSYLHGLDGALENWSSGNDGSDNMDSSGGTEADESLISITALHLKRIIEAAVVSAHPEWAEQGMVGEDVQAFSDFLVFVLDSPTILSEWAICIFDTSSGFVDIYQGKNYHQKENDDWKKSNALTLRYVPGHYQPLLPSLRVSRPTLDNIVSSLDKAGVSYVITDGTA